MADIALVTSRDWPNLVPDDRLLLDALTGLGWSAEPAVWSDPSYPWSTTQCAVVRSTWDYSRDYGHFVEWIDRTASRTRLENPGPVLRWNSHKSYLRDLALAGIETVPTRWIGRESPPTILDLFPPGGWTDIVLKPAVSAGAYRTRRFTVDASDAALEHLRTVIGDTEAMVQPFLRAFESEGEHSLVYLDGVFTHAVRRAAGMGSVHHLDAYAPIVATSTERDLAARVLARAPPDLLYARVDLVTLDDGRPVLGELEVIEPLLFLAADPGRAPTTFARAITRRLEHGPSVPPAAR
ncbi:MAG: ATP-grasp domain-containing protein [Thermoplasmata archaeon]